MISADSVDSSEIKHSLISIVMPAFNAEKTIKESIQSVLQQSYNNWELIVIDDGSKDNTSSIVKEFQKKDSRIKLLVLSVNKGLPNARNEGCKSALGVFIAFLDSDDLWTSDKLAVQLDYHYKNPHIEISHTGFDSFNQFGKINRPGKWIIAPRRHKKSIIYPEVCYRNPIGILTVMVKKEILASVDYFDSTLKTFEDQDLWIRISRTKKEFGYISKTLAHYRFSDGGLSKQIGPYKRAYKVFIRKILTAEEGKVNSDLIWRYYYRLLGTSYFRSGKLYLSFLYFKKSITLVFFDLVALSTLVYIMRIGLKYLKFHAN